MKQRINLLPPRPKVERDWLDFGTVAAGLTALLLVCAGITGWLWYDTNQNTSAIAEQSSKLSQQKAELADLIKALEQRKPDAGLVSTQSRLQQQLDSKRRLLTLLDTVQPGQQKGFSAGMKAFSDSVPDKVWMTAFMVSSDKQRLSLSGQAADASLIPAFLRRLAQKEPFQTVNFSELKTTRESEQVFSFDAQGVKSGGSHEG